MKKFIQSILPGLFLIGFNIGTGSVTAMAKAGANYGMSLLWAILLSCITTYFLISMYGRFTLATGLTAIQAFRRHIHPGVALFFLVALSFIVCGSIMGVMGIFCEVLFVWSKTWIAGGIPALTWAVISCVIIYGLLLIGKVAFFEKLLAIVVAVMGVCFILNFFLMMPPVSAIMRGLVPNIPQTTEGSSPFLVIASMVGTTVATVIFLIRTTLVQEAGWTMKDEAIQKRDAMISAMMMFVISASIMASAAGTLYPQGLKLDKASEMVNLLTPIAGTAAVSLFVLGITAAGFSSQFPNVLVVPWLYCDYTNEARDMKLLKFRVVLLMMTLLGLVVPIFKASPVLVMIISQVFGALILPAAVICLFYLSNKESLMGEYRNNKKQNAILSIITLFSFVMCSIGIKGLLDRFS